MQAVGPPPPSHQASGEFINNHDLVVLHNVLLVPKEQGVGAQCRHEMVHEQDVRGVIERRAGRQQANLGQDSLGFLMAGLGDMDLMRLAIDPVIPLGFGLVGARLGRHRRQQRRHCVHALVELGVVISLTADDERRARFINQDRIDLINNREMKATLHPVNQAIDHVVAKVIEAKFVIGAVGDVGGIGLLLFAMGHLRQVDPVREPKKPIDTAHPLRIASSQIVVDGHHMNTTPSQRIEIGGQCRHQGFALARAHFGDAARVQGHSTDQLNIKVAHPQHPPGCLPAGGKGLGQQRVE